MKTIFTSLCLLISTQFISTGIFSQCNYSAGSTGPAAAVSTPIIIDGQMNDWGSYLNNPNNNSYDNTALIDLDAPISDNGRDLSRFVFTEDANNLYIRIERKGSSNNKVDIIYYADINDDGIMQSKEPVFHIDWGGSNGNVNIKTLNYNPSLLSGLANNLMTKLDGLPLLGSLQTRSVTTGANGKGSADGKSVEIKIPFSQITRIDPSGTVIDQLQYGENFKFHVSTINGNISSAPGGINDNFGGCLRAPSIITLPVKLVSFSAMLTDDIVDIKWTTASEKNVSHFSIEKSTDGKTYTEAGLVFAYGNTSETINYSFSDKNINTSKAGVIYYRLRSVDIDGKNDLSIIRSIRIAKKNEQGISILTYPNPVTTGLRITIPSKWQGKKVSYELLNNNGQAVIKNIIGAGSQTETMNLNSVAPGFYIVKVNCNGEIAQQKIIKK